MAINQYTKDDKTFFEVYVIERDEAGKKFQRRRRGIASRRQAERVEFELKKEVEAAAYLKSKFLFHPLTSPITTRKSRFSISKCNQIGVLLTEKPSNPKT